MEQYCALNEGILSLGTDAQVDIPWCELDNFDEDGRKEQLQKICTMNVAKTPGRASSDEREPTDFVGKNAKSLLRQLDICPLDIIICCGTAKYYKMLMATDIQWDTTSRNIAYAKDSRRLAVDYYHQAHIRRSMLYYTLIDAI